MAGRNVLIVLLVSALAVMIGGLTVLYLELAAVILICVVLHLFELRPNRELSYAWLGNLKNQMDLIKSVLPKEIPEAARERLNEADQSYALAQRLWNEEEYAKSFDEVQRGMRLIDRAFWIATVGDESLLAP